MNSSSLGHYVLSSVLAVSVLVASSSSGLAQASCTTTKDVFLNPFNKNSAHHRPIGTGAQYASDSHPATRDWLKASSFALNVGGPWGVDAVAVTASDPVVRISGKAQSIGLPVSIRLPRNGHQTNIGFNAFGTTDGVSVIYDRSSAQTHELFQYDWNNGSPNASIYRSWNIKGLGHGTSSGQRLGTSASGVAMLFGMLRGFEINKSGHPIEHALQIALPRLDLPNQKCNIMLSRDIVVPATTRDGSAGQAGQNTGNIHYGALMALPRNIDISRLGLSEPGQRLAHAMQKYGAYIVDGGGCGGGAMRADQDVSSQVRSQLSKDIPKFYRLIRMVLNNDVMGSSVAGGGQPIAPNCAFDAGASQNVASTPSAGSSGNSSGGSTSTPQNSGGSGSGNTATAQNPPASNTQAGKNWAIAQDYWVKSYWNKKKMDASKPGSSDYQLWKNNYERTIALYIEYAARAGITVDAKTPPEAAFTNNAPATNTASSSSASSKPQSSSNAGASSPPASNTQAGKDWAIAQDYWVKSYWNKKKMDASKPGSSDYYLWKNNYERTIALYIKYAARAGVSVDADTPPERAFS